MRASGIVLSTLSALSLGSLWVTATRAEGTDAELPVKRVTLYTSGVGYFERSGAVSGDATETLLFPVGQVNDVLKSLILLDYGGGAIQPVTYGARDPLDKQLQAFSIDLSDAPAMAVLLGRMRGATVTVTVRPLPAEGAAPLTPNPGGGTLTGTVLGVEARTVTLPNNGGTTVEQTLNLLSDDGLHAVKLSDIAGVKIADPKLDRELREALSTIAQGRDTTKRPVRLSFHGTGKRDVLVGYLTEAPLWQTTYRLVLGDKPLLQGWALVQNTSQDDWDGVDLSLVSGRPISFTQDLYTPLYVSRPEIKTQLQVATGPVTYDSNLREDAKAGGGGYPGAPMAAAPPPAPAAEPSQTFETLNATGSIAYSTTEGDMPAHKSAARMQALSKSMSTQGAQLGQSLFSYHIKTPVSVPRQQSAMIPFVSAGISATPVSIFNAGVNAVHPLSGTRVTNNTAFHLMGGPITVFDNSGSENGYVGDALIDDTEPGQKRLISYAVDTAVDAVQEPNADDGAEITSLVINKGVLVVTNKEQTSTKYTFKNHASKARTVVVEDPYPGDDWELLTPAKATEHTREVDRFDVPVDAGASKTFVVSRERTEDEDVALLDTDLNTIVAYMKNGKISPAVKDALQEVIKRRQAVSHIDKEIANRRSDSNVIAQGQERIRNNMKALDHTSALYKRYVGELDAQETKLQSLQDQITQLQADRNKAQNELANYVGSLTLK